jgi:hypothetical protein
MLALETLARVIKDAETAERQAIAIRLRAERGYSSKVRRGIARGRG